MTLTCSALSFNRPRFVRMFNSLLIHPVSSASRPPKLRPLPFPNISNRTSNLLKTYLSDLQGRLPRSGEQQPPPGGERVIKIVLSLWEIFLQLFSFLSFSRWWRNIERRHRVIECAFQRRPSDFKVGEDKLTFLMHLS